ncbi:MAG: aspartate 1-decarboxylase [Myxococcota bacterium]
MRRRMFLSKIHRATVTQADLHYEGSVTIDEDLLDAAAMVEHQEVHVWNVTRGTRLVTYTLKGPRKSGVICINGAAAHLMQPGDMVILATFGELDESEVATHEPVVVRVNGQNEIISTLPEIPGPNEPRPLS